MTLNETIQKIDTSQHLIGQEVPKWNSPVLEMIPAPVDARFSKYIETYKKTGDYKKAILKVRSKQFDILLIFRTPKKHLSLVYQWYGFFYPDQKKLSEKNEQYEFEAIRGGSDGNNNQLPAA